MEYEILTAAPETIGLDTMAEVTDVYVDGGLLGVNAKDTGCTEGGTFACVFLSGETEVLRVSGIVLPGECPGVTNNDSEFVAALVGLSSLPMGWCGTLHTDSQVTVCRLQTFIKFRDTKPGAEFRSLCGKLSKMQVSLTRRLVGLMKNTIMHLGEFSIRHLDGHPSCRQLEMGIGKRGNPVSIHNAHCDYMCNAERERWRERKNPRP